MKATAPRLRRFYRRTGILIGMASNGLLLISSNAAIFSDDFDLANGQHTYINGLGNGNWVSSFEGVTPHSGTDFFASANGNSKVDLLGIGLTTVLGGSMNAEPYAVSLYVTTYNPSLAGVSFSDFLELRIGGIGGTMQWQNTPTPVQDTVWLQWSGTYIPSATDVGAPFLFHAVWNERAMTAIAIDGLMIAQPVPEPTTCVLFALGGFVILSARKRSFTNAA